MLLKLGSEGDDVKKLQEKLGIEAIGKFGPKTDAAVKAWQTANGLTADGIVGDGTWGKLFGSAAPAAPVAASPVANSGNLKLANLKGHIPDAVIAMIPDTASKFGINTPLRLAHFLAQCGHESGGFRATQENLNYSAKGLMGIFKKYFPTAALAASYERKPEKIANRVYASRMGNGAEASGDGYKFRGRGYIQLTGKENYTAFGKAINENILANPDSVSSKYALLSAAWFFSKNGLHRMADEGSSDQVVTKITKRVNGGTIGLPDRIKHFKEYYKLLA
ncbi:peptidoglycan-binding protein [Flavobacterium sp.]|uniref:peptidoglycan-binding protein n=1 Tax=Flavobacterium sp. TaxID=239 RepID=UPI0025E79F84|nr:peptidoglycan-binding protein [Flavobacterium sp.]